MPECSYGVCNGLYEFRVFMATPHKARLETLYEICAVLPYISPENGEEYGYQEN